MEKIEYQAFTNQNNKNNNISRINGLLERIGTNSKSLLNKLKFKKSKSVEFLELIDENLEKILENINLDNIERQLNKSKKLFKKLLVDFKEKIKNKSTNNKERLESQIDIIYKKNFMFFPTFSEKIYIIPLHNFLTIEQWNKLLSIQEELIELFRFYYKDKDKDYKELKRMRQGKIETSRIIKSMTPNVKSRNINTLFSQSESLLNQVTKMQKSEIDNKKQELSAYIMDLLNFISQDVLKKNKPLRIEDIIKSHEVIYKLKNLYFLIFEKEYNVINKNSKNFESNKFNSIIPNRNTYENLISKKQEIQMIYSSLPRY